MILKYIFEVDPDWGEYWDLCLEATVNSRDWSRASYHAEENNCFTFVLSVLRRLNQRPFTGVASNIKMSSNLTYNCKISRLGKLEGKFLSEANPAQDCPCWKVHHALQETDSK